MGRGSAVWLAAAALLLNACDRPAVTTTYVSGDGSSVALLQLTENADHHLSGTLQTVTLDSNGAANAVSADVTGLAEDSAVTLTILGGPAASNRTLHGIAANGDLDLAGFWPHGAGPSGMAHFSPGNVADFKATVAQLTRTRMAQLEQAHRAQQAQMLSNDTATLPMLNRDAILLSQTLRAFVADARRVIALEPGVVAAYRQSVSDHRKKLASIRRLMADSGTAPSARKHRQAQRLLEQMRRRQRAAGGADQTLDHAEQAWRAREANENQGIARFQGHCPGPAAISGKLMLDTSLCNDLFDSAAAYQAILDPLHAALAGAGEARAHGEMQLARIEHAAARALVPRPAGSTAADAVEDDVDEDDAVAPAPASLPRAAQAMPGAAGATAGGLDRSANVTPATPDAAPPVASSATTAPTTAAPTAASAIAAVPTAAPLIAVPPTAASPIAPPPAVAPLTSPPPPSLPAAPPTVPPAMSSGQATPNLPALASAAGASAGQ